jgi:O-methyltransferase
MNLKNVAIRKGIFPEETGVELESCQFRFCHIDVDVYQSGKDILEWVWPRIPAGGVVVFDDFGFASCAGITQLVHEEEQLPDRVCVQNLNGHAVFIKVS